MAAVLGGPEVGLVKWNRTIDPPNPRVDADVTVSFGRHVSVLAAGMQGQVFAVVTCFLVRNAMLARIPEFFNKQSENYFLDAGTDLSKIGRRRPPRPCRKVKLCQQRGQLVYSTE